MGVDQDNNVSGEKEKRSRCKMIDLGFVDCGSGSTSGI
jgi:hypothetical protein